MIKSKKTSTFSTKKLCFIAMWTAILCIISPISIPLFQIPITFSTIVVFLSGILLGMECGTISVAVYIALGAIGLPVFSGFLGGMGVLLGPTGGFLIGYIGCSFVVGLLYNKTKLPPFIIMGIGTLIIYLFGLAWYMVVTNSNFIVALLVCVVPFILIDAIKILLTTILLKYVKPIFDKIFMVQK